MTSEHYHLISRQDLEEPFTVRDHVQMCQVDECGEAKQTHRCLMREMVIWL